MKIKYDIELMKIMTMFENITRSKVKDVIKREDSLIFIVQSGEIGRAIGKKAVNVRKLERAFKKKVRIIEFSDDLATFVKNVIMPYKGEVIVEDAIVTIKSPDSQTRGFLIGRAANALRNTEKIVQRFFPIDEIKVA